MLRVLKELAELCKADDPELFEYCHSAEDVNDKVLVDFAAERGLQTYIGNTYTKLLCETTIEDCINAYSEGFTAVIRDGKFYGFKKAV